mmetsp:Transcript_5075/g.12953  ORF Transcript_5075/g.12953 Transcript_5075/m.12953 type:complete len:280 (+) Transcript_5075:146-985(+)
MLSHQFPVLTLNRFCRLIILGAVTIQKEIIVVRYDTSQKYHHTILAIAPKDGLRNHHFGSTSDRVLIVIGFVAAILVVVDTIAVANVVLQGCCRFEGAVSLRSSRLQLPLLLQAVQREFRDFFLVKSPFDGGGDSHRNRQDRVSAHDLGEVKVLVEGLVCIHIDAFILIDYVRHWHGVVRSFRRFRNRDAVSFLPQRIHRTVILVVMGGFALPLPAPFPFAGYNNIIHACTARVGLLRCIDFSLVAAIVLPRPTPFLFDGAGTIGVCGTLVSGQIAHLD